MNKNLTLHFQIASLEKPYLLRVYPRTLCEDYPTKLSLTPNFTFKNNYTPILDQYNMYLCLQN